MKHDKKIRISTGSGRKSLSWLKKELMWSEFLDRLNAPDRSTETIEEYFGYAKSRQDDLKDVGGFVGGTFIGDRRKAANVEGRDLVTLDLDNIPSNETEAIIKRVSSLGCASRIYSTRKHTSYAPRLRVVIPMDRTLTPDEYEPVARKLGELIGMDYCDPTTFEASRLMYWPSVSSDSQYVCERIDNPFCAVEGILSTYHDWHDITTWPKVPGAEILEKRAVARQENPLTKKGVIGAFCRSYNILQAMEKFIPGMYEPTAMSDRYTFMGGSTAGGAVVYDDDLFLYSHHATDPCSGLLVNAFDFIRLHLYGKKDDEAKEGTPASKLPSFVLMSKLARTDDKVSKLMVQEKFQHSRTVLNQEDTVDEGNFDWVQRLTVDNAGKFEKTINNITLILENDMLLKGKIATDEFASCGVVLGAVPWDASTEKRRWKDVDDAGYYRYMETMYGITGREKLEMGLLIVSNQNKINGVKEYLVSLRWDGVKRLDTLLVDYLGSKDTAYTRAVMRKSLCAAVGRGIIGGVKFDNMPILVGAQGIGKSTFLSIIGKDWFSDSLTSFEGKEAAELIQGTWINEVGELTAMSKQETNTVKQFLSKSEDIYRAAYGRRTEKYPRRCIFFGTSNESEFLKDATGNRRFWPIDVGEFPATKSVWKDLPEEIDQVWAEAYAYWMLGEPLYLSKEIEEMAKVHQSEHAEHSSKEGIILDYLEKELPSNWDTLDVSMRRAYLNGGLASKGLDGLTKRDKVCAAEIWVECFGSDIRFMKRADSVEINHILTRIDGWERNKEKRRYGPFGKQRGFEKVSPN